MPQAWLQIAGAARQGQGLPAEAVGAGPLGRGFSLGRAAAGADQDFRNSTREYGIRIALIGLEMLSHPKAWCDFVPKDDEKKAIGSIVVSNATRFQALTLVFGILGIVPGGKNLKLHENPKKKHLFRGGFGFSVPTGSVWTGTGTNGQSQRWKKPTNMKFRDFRNSTMQYS